MIELCTITCVRDKIYVVYAKYKLDEFPHHLVSLSTTPLSFSAFYYKSFLQSTSSSFKTINTFHLTFPLYYVSKCSESCFVATLDVCFICKHLSGQIWLAEHCHELCTIRCAYVIKFILFTKNTSRKKQIVLSPDTSFCWSPIGLFLFKILSALVICPCILTTPWKTNTTV